MWLQGLKAVLSDRIVSCVDQNSTQTQKKVDEKEGKNMGKETTGGNINMEVKVQEKEEQVRE